jgi:hypothetical protein
LPEMNRRAKALAGIVGGGGVILEIGGSIDLGTARSSNETQG